MSFFCWSERTRPEQTLRHPESESGGLDWLDEDGRGRDRDGTRGRCLLREGPGGSLCGDLRHNVGQVDVGSGGVGTQVDEPRTGLAPGDKDIRARGEGEPEYVVADAGSVLEEIQRGSTSPKRPKVSR